MKFQNPTLSRATGIYARVASRLLPFIDKAAAFTSKYSDNTGISETWFEGSSTDDYRKAYHQEFTKNLDLKISEREKIVWTTENSREI